MPAARILVCVLVLPATLAAQTIFPTSPDWVSADGPIGTGAALADLNNDGWPDLVVSNGNDIERQRVAVYYNDGGTLQASPGWESADIGYHGHLDVADVNGDGWLDVAVSRLLNESGPAARLYLNVAGTLESTPSWVSDEKARAFDVKFGDVNNDGRPDLAVATGWPYDPGYDARNTVHLNVGGQLESVASWQSSDTHHYLGALWVDADSDGWLDLVGVGTKTYTWLYRNLGGTLETNASWHSTDNANQFGIMATAGDVNGDLYPELFVTDNTQLGGGSGRFKQYNGLSAGLFAPTYSWSYLDGYGAAVALGDVNADGRLDLATGAWWDRTRIFLNQGGGLPGSPNWNSAGTTVVEKIVLADVDRNGLRRVVETFDPTPPDGTLCRLRHQPIQHVISVHRGDTLLSPAQYTLSREHGWVTAGGDASATVRVEYHVSSRLDMAVANWDEVGTYVYYNRLTTPGDANCDGSVNGGDIQAFVLALTDLDAYGQAYPGCDPDYSCDMNVDGSVNAMDIEGFVDVLQD